MLMQSSKTKGPYILTCSVFPILKRSLWSFWVIRRLAGCGLEHGSIEKKSVKLQLPKTEFLDFSVQIGANENGMKPKTIRKWKYRQCHEDFGRKSHRCEAANFFEPKVKSVILFVDGFRKIKNCERLGL